MQVSYQGEYTTENYTLRKKVELSLLKTQFVPHSKHSASFIKPDKLTLNLLTTTIVAPPSNASKWQMGFNSAFKGLILYRGADKSLARPGRKQATATEDFDVHISYS